MSSTRIYRDPHKRKWTVRAMLIGAAVLAMALVLVQPLRQNLKMLRADDAVADGRQLMALIADYQAQHGTAAAVRDLSGRLHSREKNEIGPMFESWRPEEPLRFTYAITSLAPTIDGKLDVCVTVSDALSDRRGPGRVYLRTHPPDDPAWEDGVSRLRFLTKHDPVGACAEETQK